MAINVYLNPAQRPGFLGKAFNKVIPWGLYRCHKVIAKSSEKGETRVELGFPKVEVSGPDEKGSVHVLYLRGKLLGKRLKNAGLQKVIFDKEINSQIAKKLFKLLLRRNLEDLFSNKKLLSEGIELYFGTGKMGKDEKLRLGDVMSLNKLITSLASKESIARNIFFNFQPDKKTVIPSIGFYDLSDDRDYEIARIPEKVFLTFNREKLKRIINILIYKNVNLVAVVNYLKELESKIENPFALTYDHSPYYIQNAERLSEIIDFGRG